MIQSFQDRILFRIVIVPVAIFLIAASIWTGLSRQGDPERYPNYADRGDAYSEQIIRNTVVNAFVGDENVSGSLIWTRGYPSNIAYDPVGTRRYHSQLGLQVEIYKVIAKFRGQLTEANSSILFESFRLMNCLIAVCILYIFFLTLLSSRVIALLATCLMSMSAGLALFGANLYWTYWMMFTPLLTLPILLAGRTFLFILMGFLFGLLYFSVRYEFATTFALMWLLPVILASTKTTTKPIWVGGAGFAAVCVSFLIAVAIHHYRVMQVEQVAFSAASRYVFENVGLRIASLDRVPFPMSLDFFKIIAFRMTENAFAFEDIFSISRFLVVLLTVVMCLFSKDKRSFLILLWILATYGSWYVFGYQHIMQHYKYDAMLFSATWGLMFTFFVCKWVVSQTSRAGRILNQ
ncbi:hypothetical protein RA27_18105 [Ruegeria sp. ANG-R]|uniref:hypothetical protein n=1 Tax=Ruegeria sp. ANG-R TaxID=1577903 RepID=UPI00057FB509|nr:hypothetical protein [Ruegeria sp. ANG-R]KIC39059.1 hypothetical protein RA27_18105 [Ruegeria sp. ANG-R]